MENLVNEIYDMIRGYLGFGLVQLTNGGVHIFKDKLSLEFTGLSNNALNCLRVFQKQPPGSAEFDMTYTISPAFHPSGLEALTIYMTFTAR